MVSSSWPTSVAARLKVAYATRREAQAAMSKVAVAVEERTHVASSRLTVRDYLSKEWLPAIEHTIRPTTYRSYVAHVECHILPALGSRATAEARSGADQRPLCQARPQRQAQRQRSHGPLGAPRARRVASRPQGCRALGTACTQPRRPCRPAASGSTEP